MLKYKLKLEKLLNTWHIFISSSSTHPNKITLLVRISQPHEDQCKKPITSISVITQSLHQMEFNLNNVWIVNNVKMMATTKMIMTIIMIMMMMIMIITIVIQLLLPFKFCCWYFILNTLSIICTCLFVCFFLICI